jgi:hypothetical protein
MKLVNNPFIDDIVKMPRRVQQSIARLNAGPLNTLLEQFENLIRQPIPPHGVHLSHVQFVTSFDAGFGKSHLIGRLFQALQGRANLVYVTPFQDPDTAWKSILNQILDEMNSEEASDSEIAPSQLQTFAHEILSRLYIQLVEKRKERIPDAEQRLERVRNKSIIEIPSDYPSLINRLQRSLALELEQLPVKLRFSATCWIAVLRAIAYPRNYLELSICRDWIRGNPVDQDEITEMGIRLQNVISHAITHTQLNERCRDMVSDLTSLASLSRPFVFCFDQTENYGNDHRLAYALAIIMQNLADEMANHLTILTTNLHPWEKNIRVYWEEAHLNRLSEQIELEGINILQALELIHQRLEGVQTEPALMQYMTDRQWLENLFAQPTMGIRYFLRKCRDRWNQYGKPEAQEELIVPAVEGKTTNLTELYSEYQQRFISNTRRHTYDRDAFYWFVNYAHPPEYTVEAIYDQRFFSLRLRAESRNYYIGFQDGSAWNTWKAIAEHAEQLTGKKQVSQVIMLRTYTLPPVPKETWSSAGYINQIQQKGKLRIHDIDKEEMTILYAGYDMFKDATSRNIEFTSREILEYLHSCFQPLWNRLLDENPQVMDGSGKTPEPNTVHYLSNQ